MRFLYRSSLPEACRFWARVVDRLYLCLVSNTQQEASALLTAKLNDKHINSDIRCWLSLNTFFFILYDNAALIKCSTFTLQCILKGDGASNIHNTYYQLHFLHFFFNSSDKWLLGKYCMCHKSPDLPWQGSLHSAITEVKPDRLIMFGSAMSSLSFCFSQSNNSTLLVWRHMRDWL